MSDAIREIEESQAILSRLQLTSLDNTCDDSVKTFRNGMANLGSAVNVITTLHNGKPVGFTATAVTSVTDTPPTLLVCLNRSSSVYDAFKDAEMLCVNTLSSEQEVLSGLFASKLPQEERFHGLEWQAFCTGAPVLLDCATAFDCKIVSRTLVGTHDVIFCEVVGIGSHPEPSNLVYFNRRYHCLT